MKSGANKNLLTPSININFKGDTMPKIVKTIVNTNQNGTKPWILDDQRQDYFTQEEINDIIIPYEEYMKNLPGAISIEIKEVDNSSLVVKLEYDTEENLQNALAMQGGNTINSVVKLRNDLYKSKMEELNLTSIIKISFE